MKPAWIVSIGSLVLAAVCVSGAEAQEIGFRGFADVGGTRFTAGT